jgi:hypothetical protein
LKQPPALFAASQLKSVLIRQLDNDLFGYADYLRELAIHARECRDGGTPAQSLLAFVLETILYKWAEELEGPPPALLSRTNALRRRFLKPVQEAVECLGSATGDPTAAAISLVAAIPKDD